MSNLPRECFGESNLAYPECIADRLPQIELFGRLACSRCIGDEMTELRREGLHDTLTGLRNERALHTEFERRVKAGERFGVIYLDISNFKNVNEIGSHLAGDYALRYVANFLSLELREDSDEFFMLQPKAINTPEEERQPNLIHRKGGDEFLIFVGGPKLDHEQLHAVTERLEFNFSNRSSTNEYNKLVAEDQKLGFRMKSMLYDPDNPVSYEQMLELVDPKVQHEEEDNAFIELFKSAERETAEEIDTQQSLNVHMMLLRRLDDMKKKGNIKS